MTDAPPDFIQPDAPREPSASLQELVASLVAKIAEKQKKDQEVEALEREIWDLSARVIPDAMDASGVDRVGVPAAGVDVRLENWTRAVLPKDTEADPTARQKAISWLVEHGHGDLIKSTVAVEFNRGQHNVASALADDLRNRYRDNKVTDKDDVHHMTYTAFIKERMAAGEVLPLDLLGASTGRVAKVVERKN